MLGWTSPAFDKLERKPFNESIYGMYIDPDSSDDVATKSWVSSSLTLGALTGCLLSGKCWPPGRRLVCLFWGGFRKT